MTTLSRAVCRVIVFLAYVCAQSLATNLAFGQNTQKDAKSDTSRQVIINNYYYGGPDYPPDESPYYYPRLHPSYFFSFSYVAPFYRPHFIPRHFFFSPRRHFMVRPFGSTRGFGMHRFGGGRMY